LPSGDTAGFEIAGHARGRLDQLELAIAALVDRDQPCTGGAALGRHDRDAIARRRRRRARHAAGSQGDDRRDREEQTRRHRAGVYCLGASAGGAVSDLGA
jgi:hypothetical protein